MVRFRSMARKLKTYTTSIGFFDLAVAAPSMKAALEAWGSNRNIFHDGLATETQDEDVVAATLAKPGVVLRRAVGTNRPFQEKAELPETLPSRAQGSAAQNKKAPAKKRRAPASEKAQQAAIISFEKERDKRETARRQAEALHAKQQATEDRKAAKRREEIEGIQQVLEQARERHAKRVSELEKQLRAVEGQQLAENERWRKEEGRLLKKIREVDR